MQSNKPVPEWQQIRDEAKQKEAAKIRALRKARLAAEAAAAAAAASAPPPPPVARSARKTSPKSASKSA